MKVGASNKNKSDLDSYLESIGDYGKLSAREERGLIREIRGGTKQYEFKVSDKLKYSWNIKKELIIVNNSYDLRLDKNLRDIAEEMSSRNLLKYYESNRNNGSGKITICLKDKRNLDIELLDSRGNALENLNMDYRGVGSKLLRIFSRTVEAYEAREKMINHNLKFVVYCAKKHRETFYSERKELTFMIEDICSGNLGLLRAIDKFNPDSGFKFSTYAKGWITQQMIRDYVEKIDISNSVRGYEQLKYLGELVEKFVKKFEVNPLFLDIWERIEMEKEKEEKVGEKSLFIAKTINERLFKYLWKAHNQKRISINQTQNSEILKDNFFEGNDLSGKRDFKGFVQISGKNYSVSKGFPELTENMVKEELENYLSILSERDRRILSKRYELGKYDEMTPKEIGSSEGISRERVRQIIKKESLEKIRVEFGFDVV